MNRNTIKTILGVLDGRLVDAYRESSNNEGAKEAIGACRTLRREIEDHLHRRVKGLEVFGWGGASFVLNGAEILACLCVARNEYVVLMEWGDEQHHKFVTAKVWVHDDSGRDVMSWDHGNYFEGHAYGDDLREAKADFAKRAGLV